jgi:hypothetical protein
MVEQQGACHTDQANGVGGRIAIVQCSTTGLLKNQTEAPDNASKVSFSGETAELRRTCEIQA